MSTEGRFTVFQGMVQIDIEVEATGALLIRGPDAFTADAPDMAFIRYPIDGAQVPFLPGSSLKGVLRSGAEALLRSLGRQICTNWQDRCLACLTFGSTRGAAVVLVDDGLPWHPGASESERVSALERIEASRAVRTSVAIDRQAGAVAAGPFDYEALVRVSFFPSLRLRNPAPWQASVVAAALGLLDDGLLRLGGMTSRGLGRVKIRCRAVEVVSLGGALAELWDQAWPTESAGPLLVRRRAPDPGAAMTAWRANLQAWLPEVPA
jgi:CRISPR/Cas system CSM-associated protein Csm3 (group 7 of RAMP superfamily)